MSGYDDPRYLKQVIEKLQKDVANLKKATLPLLSYQRGPTPGWMNAAQIGPGPGMKSSMHLHLDANMPGIAPRLSVTDASGVVRFEVGNLSASGVSGAQYGWRVVDSNNVPIADAIGLSQVMKLLGRGDRSGGQNFTTTTPTLITGCTTTFSLVRAIRILAFLVIVGADSAQTGQCDLFVDNVDVASTDPGVQATLWYGVSGPTTTSMNFYSASLAAGNHTLEMRAFVQVAGGTFSVQGATLMVFSLGT